MMAIGIRSAAVLRVSAEDATPETSRPPASLLITAEGPTAVGTLLARPGAPRQAWASARGRLHDQGRFTVALVSEARTSVDPISAARLSLDRARVAPRLGPSGTRDSDRARTYLVAHASIPLVASAVLATAGVGAGTVGAETDLEGSAGMATVGTEVFGLATDTTTVVAGAFLVRALAGALAGAGDGDLAWDGRTGVATGDRAGLTDGIRGGTTRIGTRPGRRTTTTIIILTSDTTIRHPTSRTLCLTTTRRRAI
jgi:hypothetical protein